MEHPLIKPLENLWDFFLKQDYETLLSFFESGSDLDLPLFGRITNDDIFILFSKRVTDWLQHNQVTCEFVDATLQPDRLVMEYLLYYTRNGAILDVPIAIAFDLAQDKIQRARGYYQTLNIIGHIVLRYAVLNEDRSIAVTFPSHAQYFKAIKEKDVASVLSAMAPDGYIGLGHKKRYGEDIRKSFQRMFQEGNVVLRYCTETKDDRKACYEFFIDKKGDFIRTPQSGIAVYGKNEQGLIDYIRIYQEPITDHRLHYFYSL